MSDIETSADQYAPVRDTEDYLNSKGGVPREDKGRGGDRDQGRNGPHRRRLESAPEEERHAAEVRIDEQRQARTPSDNE